MRTHRDDTFGSNGIRLRYTASGGGGEATRRRGGEMVGMHLCECESTQVSLILRVGLNAREIHASWRYMDRDAPRTTSLVRTVRTLYTRKSKRDPPASI